MVVIFAFLELEQKLPFFKGLIVREGLQVELRLQKKPFCEKTAFGGFYKTRMCRFPTLELSRSGSKGVISGVLQPPRMLSYVLNYREQEIISQEPISKRFVKSHFLTTELTEHREYLILLTIYLCDLRGLCGKFDFL